MFHRKTLNVAVAAALGGMVTASSNVLADAVLFPHVVVSDTVTTIVSVINTTNDLYNVNGDRIPWNARTGQGYLHYRIFYKDAANLTRACDEYDTWLPTSVNDLQTIDLGATDGSGVLFETPNRTGHARVVGWEGNDYALGTYARGDLNGAALRGYLLVDNAESDAPGYVNDEPTIFGEAIVVEWGVGATWGYHAFSKQDDSVWEQANPDFDREFDFEDAASISSYPVSFLPLEVGATPDDQIMTSFMVTPVIYPKADTEQGSPGYPDSDMSENPAIANTSIYLHTTPHPMNWGSDLGLWDRDEVKHSGGNIVNVTCVGRVSVQSLLSDTWVDTNRLVDGGWGRLRNSTMVSWNDTLSNGTPTTGAWRVYDSAIIYKLEYGMKLNGLHVGGTWNNAFLIPNSYDVLSD